MQEETKVDLKSAGWQAAIIAAIAGGLGILITRLPDDFTSIAADPIYIIGALKKLIFAGLAVLMVVWFSRWLDRRSGGRFKEIFLEKIIETSMGAAVYAGFRWLGVCVLVGLAVSN